MLSQVVKDGKENGDSRKTTESPNGRRVVRKDRSVERIELVKQCFFRVAESERAAELLDQLSFQERVVVSLCRLAAVPTSLMRVLIVITRLRRSANTSDRWLLTSQRTTQQPATDLTYP